MPFAPADDKGTQFYYEDSGSPTGCDTYTTLVIVHGAYFNGGIFYPLFPFAEENNFRIILLNQRDYHGSTPFSDAEFHSLYSQEKNVQYEFFRSRLMEFTSFLQWFIKEKNPPRMYEHDGIRTGGIAVITWSSGNHLGVQLLGSADLMPYSTSVLLKEYLRSVVLYDSPPSTVGFPGPTVEEHYCPLVDPLLSSTEKIKQFPIWVSGYYTHTPQTFDAFSESTYDVLPSRADFLKGLSSRRDVQPSPTSTRIAPETLKEISDDEGLVRSHLPIIFADLSIFKEALERALFDDDLAKRTFPNVTVEVVVCSRSTGYCVFAGMEIYKLMLKDREARDAHPAVRKVSLHIWEGMNHAAHVDFPKKVLGMFANIV